jgi:STE24 endopeptidase
MDAGSMLAPLVALAVYARVGGRFARDSAAGPIGTGMYLTMLGFAIVWAVQVPWGLAQLWWDRHHHLVHTGYAAWLVDGWFGLTGQFLYDCLAIAVIMGLARLVGRRWWLPAWPAFAGLALLLAFLTPYLTPDHPVRSAALARDMRALERSEHVGGVALRVQDVAGVTSAANAESVGLGPGRTVVLWNTLLDGRFDRREIRFVLAHELGHQAHGDVWRLAGWYALFALPGLFLLAAATRRRGSLRTPAAVPLLLLVLALLQLAATPLQNVVSRRVEAEADWAALQTTHDPAAARRLFVDLSRAGGGAPDEPTLAYVMLETHPTIVQRVAMAEAWQARQR